ncbi:hypothetical protein CHARACLAT_025364 [Characodon lateralis]|uniref:Uncharacterized protein n=1 Tax=Characodon lateralis TaxID=208331 RepID=A0ABU7DUB9_9TELE|nr:hypothetical protein [Characodon lateralis]
MEGFSLKVLFQVLLAAPPTLCPPTLLAPRPSRLQPVPGNKQGDGPTATQGLRRSSSPTDSTIRTGGKESATEHYQPSSSYFTKGKTPQSFPRSSFGSSLTWSAVKGLSATKTGCRTFQSMTTSQGSYLILKVHCFSIWTGTILGG